MAAPKGNKFAVGAASGRKTKYKKTYCDKLIDHMKKGYSFESFAATINTSRRVLYDWEEKHKEFLHAKQIGREHQQFLFERIGIGATTGQVKNFNYGAFKWLTTNMIGWTDKIEDTGETNKVITLNYSIEGDKNGDKEK